MQKTEKKKIPNKSTNEVNYWTNLKTVPKETNKGKLDCSAQERKRFRRMIMTVLYHLGDKY